jgi:hypothetical protein
MSEPKTPVRQTILRLKTTVLANGKVEITAPQLPVGEDVEVIIMLPQAADTERRSALDILSETPGHRQFRTAEEVETYLREERQAWER